MERRRWRWRRHQASRGSCQASRGGASIRLLVDHSSKFALVVAPAAGKVLECSARITEAADSVYVLCFSVDHRAVQCGVGVSSAEIQLVGLAGNQRSATQRSDDYSLLD